MAKVASNPEFQPPLPTKKAAAIGEMAVLFALICLLAAEPVPGVNESHYLPKAKHLFNRSFCPGDLFFESHDAHGLAAGFAGALAIWLPLTAVAWVGRILSWLCLAWAWQKLRIAIGIHWILGALSLSSWYFAIDYGNWAGEWAIGGFEGKSLAYPCIIVALAELFRDRWARVWVWLGLAVAWHPLVGGWAGLSFGIAWLFLPGLWGRARSQAPWLTLAVAIGLAGVIPAGLGLNSPNQVGNLVASQIHVYRRLAHHLCPSLFSLDRHIAGGVSLGLLIAATVLAWCVLRKENRERVRQNPSAWLLTLGWIAVSFSAVGLLIDRAFSLSNPIFASQLLRFYWFRGSDIVVPLAWTLTFWKLTETCFHSLLTSNGASPPQSAAKLKSGKKSDSEQIDSPRRSKRWAITAQLMAGVLVVFLLVRHTQSNFSRQYPAADEILMKAPMTRTIDTDRYIDWLAACDWARKNSPPDSLWFTPEHQQTFKWYAGRAEVVCWKDVPQDNASVRKWYERLILCRQPRTPNNERTEWTSEQIKALSRRYGFRWVIVDRGTQINPLYDLEIMYPTETQNKSFAIFRVIKQK
jgi:hypothetical protein